MNLLSHCFSQNMNKKLLRFLPSLHRAEILTFLRLNFGRNDDFINSFWNCLTFKIACEYRFMDIFKLHMFSKTNLHALQYVTAWYYSKYRFMKINLIFKDYESEIYKNDQEVERSSAFWWWFDLIEFLMILFRGLLFEIIVNWVFWVFWEPRIESRTTDAQRENSLHCTAKNSIPIPNV